MCFFFLYHFKREHHWRLVDKVKSKFFLKYEILKMLSKASMKNSHMSLLYKYYMYMKLMKLVSFSGLSMAKNSCVLSGSTYGVLSFFKLSSFFLKNNLIKMNTYGLSSLSW